MQVEVITIVITRVGVTATVIGGQGSIKEEHRLVDGLVDCIEGNFEDESGIPDTIVEALVEIHDPAIAILKHLNAIQGEVRQ